MLHSSTTPLSVLAGVLLPALLGLVPAASAQTTEQAKLLPNDGQAGDYFGTAVATDGARIAVGAPTADQSGTSSGSAYVFATPSGTQLLELVPANGAAGDQLGASIAIDGTRVAVGAPLADRAAADSGTVYLFDATSGAPLLELVPSNPAAGDQFGYAVAMDGGLVAVGALGTAYVFDASTGQQLHELVPSGGSTTLGLGSFGEALALEGGRVIVGARTENGVSGISGAAYVFDAASGNQLHRLIANNGTAWAFFGASVAIDGDVIAIGAPESYGGVGKHSGVAYVFDASSGQQLHYLWPHQTEGGHLFAKFGSSVAVDGQDVYIGAEKNHASPPAGFAANAGSVRLYDAQSGSLVDKLIASDAAPWDYLGGAVAAADGILAVGAARDDDLGDASGSAYLFGTGNDPSEPGSATCECSGGAPCGNTGGAGTGCQNSTGLGALLGASGMATIGADTVVLHASQCPPSVPGLFFSGPQSTLVPLADGQLCVGGSILRIEVVVTDAAGSASSSTVLSTFEGLSGGETRFYQYWVRDVTGPCGNGSNTSNGYRISW